jgi:hypothetical protein
LRSGGFGARDRVCGFGWPHFLVCHGGIHSYVLVQIVFASSNILTLANITKRCQDERN